MTTAIPVSIAPTAISVGTTYEDGRISTTVSVTAPGLKRAQVYGIGMPDKPANRKLISRFTHWVKSGKAFNLGEIKQDIYGNTYMDVKWSEFPIGRTLNATLTRAGF